MLGRMGEGLGLKERSGAAASARASKVNAAWAPAERLQRRGDAADASRRRNRLAAQNDVRNKSG